MIAAYQALSQARVNAALETLFDAPAPELTRLYAAMRYSVTNGGKRVRPLLVYAACEALGGNAEHANGAACAVELIHAYSLVHDDLPAMDDDDLRRGLPTTHKAFDEACAILAGDGLQTLAFSVLSDNALTPQDADTRLKMVATLARASGPAGMVGGQAIDLGSVGLKLDQTALEFMHRHKTGALIEASVRLGALASGNATPGSIRLAADLRPRHRPGLSGAGRHSRRRKRYRHAGQDARATILPATSRPTPRCWAWKKPSITHLNCAIRPLWRCNRLMRPQSPCARWRVISSNAAASRTPQPCAGHSTCRAQAASRCRRPISPAIVSPEHRIAAHRAQPATHQVNCRFFYL